MNPLPSRDKLRTLTLAEAELIVRLRLLVVRAAQPDSLRWWDDRSLTVEGGYLTERLFSRRPRLAAAQIAMATARARHWAAIPKTPKAVHLFDFGDDLEYELEAVALDEAWIPAEPFATQDALLLAVGRVIPDGTGYSTSYSGQGDEHTGALEIQISVDADPTLKPPVAQAAALALAYGVGGPDRPVFPYLKLKR